MQASRSRATMAMMRMSVRSAVIHHMFAPPRRVVGLMREGCKLPPGAIRLNHPAQFGTIRLHQKNSMFHKFQPPGAIRRNHPAQFGLTSRPTPQRIQHQTPEVEARWLCGGCTWWLCGGGCDVSVCCGGGGGGGGVEVVVGALVKFGGGGGVEFAVVLT